MNRVLSWLYHHSAKFRDLKLGQINRKIEKFIGSSNQKQDIDLFMIKSDKLEELSKTNLKPIYYPTQITCSYSVIDWKECDSKKKLIDNINTYGFGVLNTKHIYQMEKIIDWFVPNEYPMSTMYGLNWDIVNNKEEAINLAYTDQELDFHQDLPYYSPPPTIQVLYCLESASQGGETILKNVYQAAQVFKTEHPKEFEILKNYKTTFQKVHYKRDAPYHLVKQIPIMEHDDNNDLIRVNWSPFVEGFTDYIDNQSWEEYYNAYFIWNNFIDNWEHVKVLLKPTQLLAFHNHHMLHGRYSYTGNRHLKGFYLSYEQWINMVNLN